VAGTDQTDLWIEIGQENLKCKNAANNRVLLHHTVLLRRHPPPLTTATATAAADEKKNLGGWALNSVDAHRARVSDGATRVRWWYEGKEMAVDWPPIFHQRLLRYLAASDLDVAIAQLTQGFDCGCFFWYMTTGQLLTKSEEIPMAVDGACVPVTKIASAPSGSFVVFYNRSKETIFTTPMYERHLALVIGNGLYLSKMGPSPRLNLVVASAPRMADSLALSDAQCVLPISDDPDLDPSLVARSSECA